MREIGQNRWRRRAALRNNYDGCRAAAAAMAAVAAVAAAASVRALLPHATQCRRLKSARFLLRFSDRQPADRPVAGGRR